MNRSARRARRAFWTLVAVAIVLTGALSWVLEMPPSPRTGLAVAVIGLPLVAVIALAARLLLALTGQLSMRGPRRGSTR